LLFWKTNPSIVDCPAEWKVELLLSLFALSHMIFAAITVAMAPFYGDREYRVLGRVEGGEASIARDTKAWRRRMQKSKERKGG
jgi:hypothetical protein